MRAFSLLMRATCTYNIAECASGGSNCVRFGAFVSRKRSIPPQMKYRLIAVGIQLSVSVQGRRGGDDLKTKIKLPQNFKTVERKI